MSEITKFNYHDLIENMHDGVYFVNKQRRITYWNRAAEKITGFSSSEVIGTSCSDNILIHVDDLGNNLCKSGCPLSQAINDEVAVESEVYLHHKNGHRLPVWVRVSPLRDQNGSVIGGAELFSDLSSKIIHGLKVKELEKLALIDPLTKLSNRAHIEWEIKARFEELLRYSLPFGVIFADIDDFKSYNDRYGHQVGDKVLETIAATIISNARPFDLFGRWGGEEFIGIIKNIDAKNLLNVAERFRMLVEKSNIQMENTLGNATMSVGCCMAEREDTIESLISRADRLMYQSKENGKNCVTIEEH